MNEQHVAKNKQFRAAIQTGARGVSVAFINQTIEEIPWPQCEIERQFMLEVRYGHGNRLVLTRSIGLEAAEEILSFFEYLRVLINHHYMVQLDDITDATGWPEGAASSELTFEDPWLAPSANFGVLLEIDQYGAPWLTYLTGFNDWNTDIHICDPDDCDEFCEFRYFKTWEEWATWDVRCDHLDSIVVFWQEFVESFAEDPGCC